VDELECRDMLDAGATDHALPHMEVVGSDGYCERCGGIPDDPIHLAARYATKLRKALADKWELEVLLKEARDERNYLKFEKMVRALSVPSVVATQAPLFGEGA
jgi:hypothetical protein